DSTDCTSSDGGPGGRRLTCATDSSVPSWIVVLPTLAAGGDGGSGSSARTRTSMPFTFFSSSLIAFDPVILYVGLTISSASSMVAGRADFRVVPDAHPSTDTIVILGGGGAWGCAWAADTAIASNTDTLIG